MVITVRYNGLISGYHAARRVDSAFDKDTLTGFNILIEHGGSVVFGLVFNDEDKQPNLEYLSRVLQEGELIEPEIQGCLPVIKQYAITFLGDGFPAFKAFVKAYGQQGADTDNNGQEEE